MTAKSDNEQTINRIRDIKSDLGDNLVILTHHYQRKEIVDIGDYRGDSFDLSRRAAANENARAIVFCGVHFMAESAEILSQPHQTVQIPDVEAGCWMADMADIYMVERAWEELIAITGENSVVPIVYMNSDAELKAFCGRNGGTVCTSSNAPAAFRWGFDQREKIFFYPDQYLGRNTANQMDIPADEMIVWDPDKPNGGNAPEDIRRAKVILWEGHCLVHTRFTVEQMENMRNRYPDAKIVVHPECTEEVVAQADAVGSTGFIVNYVKDAPSGTTVVVGTETNLIQRLADENPDKEVLELHHSLCPNMYKINLDKLLYTIQDIGGANRIAVTDDLKQDARLALDRMLALAP